ncbi:magnesium chelatase subunit D [Cesiribacter andamanensis AMV16]|uniref:Magnesium chelatase subunit D n=2 Tax=Cesiribacter TaxID=1133570 RepID=M7N536_9BACT|nr:magnesium chelatase subunit D [Cesiribacter andamanensis AMV16]
MLLVFSSWSASPEAPFTVSGLVTDAANGSPLPGVAVRVKGSTQGTVTDIKGTYQLQVPSEQSVLQFSFVGYRTKEQKVGSRRSINVKLEQEVEQLQEVIVTGHSTRRQMKMSAPIAPTGAPAPQMMYGLADQEEMYPTHNTEEYATVHENAFREVLQHPLSTFSIDVDNASYANMRRFIMGGQTPPKDAVRIEEMVNYFSYNYPQPKGEDPFSVTTELSECPWNPQHQLLHIGLQGKKIATENLPPSNLVFLIDVSGSMNTPERLPLVKAAFKLLVAELRPQDRVAMVVYAGAAGLVLPSTPGDRKGEILAALERLEAGGSTAGGAGLRLAYQVAEEHFQKGGNNRVILASDGDFNVGVSSTAAMERLVEEKRETGVFLTVLGFGMGNYKDSRMETMANKGNGNYAYIDNILEAKKVFVNEFGGTLFTIAKDVKLQLEFNPAKVKGYRLIGYENRLLNKEDFNNDKKDAGELGSGHTVTALYEIIPAGSESPFLQLVDPLKYQKETKIAPGAARSNELLSLKLRYKQPDGATSKLIETTVSTQTTPLDKTSDNFRFSAAVAGFGMLLRDSEFKGNLTYPKVLVMAKGAQGRDEEGYRAEFLNLVRSMEIVAKK